MCVHSLMANHQVNTPDGPITLQLHVVWIRGIRDEAGSSALYVHLYVYLHTHNTGNVVVGGARGAAGRMEMIIRYLFLQVSDMSRPAERSDVRLSETRGFIYVCVYIYVLPSIIFSAIHGG